MTGGWRSLILWGAGALVMALIGVSFVLWGLNGPAYLIDMIETYCL